MVMARVRARACLGGATPWAAPPCQSRMSLLSGAYHHPHPHPQDAAAFYQPLYGPPHAYLHHLPHQGAVEPWDGSGSCSSSSPNSPPPQQLSVGGGDFGSSLGAVGVMRGGRQRNCANKKERKRTQSINNAFADLRDCIPNVPADTKLSKIKTLRLATSYIAYLMRVLATEDPATCEPPAFRADIASGRRGHVLPPPSGTTVDDLPLGDDCESTAVRRAKGRTGWPQHVWALELKQEQL